MLTLVQVVCRRLHAQVGSLSHVLEIISLFLLDPYSVSLSEAVWRDAPELLNVLMEPTFGKHFTHREVCDAIYAAATRNRLHVIQNLFKYASCLRSLDRLSVAFGRQFDDGHPFDAAAANGHLQIVQWLFENHPNVATRSSIKEAAANGHLNVVRFLFDQKIGQQKAETALAKAAARGHQTVVAFLCEQINVRCFQCLIEKAILHGHLSTANWLQAHQADNQHQELQNSKCSKPHGFLLASSINSLSYDMKSDLARSGGLKAFQWLADRFPSIEFDGSFLSLAARAGKLDLVQWLYEQLEEEDRARFAQKALRDACTWGQMKVAKFFICRGHVPSLNEAVECGNIEIVKYVQMHDADGSIKCSRTAMHSAIARAARDGAMFGGHTEMVKFLEPECSEEYPNEIIYDAAQFRNVEMLEYMLANRNDKYLVVEALKRAISHGHLECVQYLYIRLKAMILSSTASSPEVHALTTRRKQEQERLLLDLVDAILVATRMKYFDVVEFLISEEPDLHLDFDRLLRKAIKAREFKLIRLLHQKRPRAFNSVTMNNAARRGSLGLVKFFHTSFRDAFTYHAMDEAATNGFLHVVEFLHQHRKEGCSTRAMDGAASNGHLQIVKFLHQHRHEGCTVDAMNFAAREGHLHVVSFLAANRKEGCTQVALDEAIKGNHLEMVHFLLTNRLEFQTRTSLLRGKQIAQSMLLQEVEKDHGSNGDDRGDTENHVDNGQSLPAWRTNPELRFRVGILAFVETALTQQTAKRHRVG